MKEEIYLKDEFTFEECISLMPIEVRENFLTALNGYLPFSGRVFLFDDAREL